MYKSSFLNKEKRFNFIKLITCLLSVLVFFTVISFNFDIKAKASEELVSEVAATEPVEMEEDSKRAAVVLCSGAILKDLSFDESSSSILLNGSTITYIFVLCSGNTNVASSATYKYCVTSRDSNTSVTCLPTNSVTYGNSIPLTLSGTSFYVAFEATYNGETATINATVTRSTAVAKIGTTEYTTLQAAINASSGTSNVTTAITLLKSVSEYVTISSSRSFSLNLNGYTWSCSNASGCLVNDTSSSNITIYGGTVKNTRTSNGGYVFVINGNGAKLTLHDVKVTMSAPYSSIIKASQGGATITIGDSDDTTSTMQLKNTGTDGYAISITTSGGVTVQLNAGLIYGKAAAVYGEVSGYLYFGSSSSTSTSANLQVISPASLPIALSSNSTMYVYGGFVGSEDSSFLSTSFSHTINYYATVYMTRALIDGTAYYGYMCDEGVASINGLSYRYMKLNDAISSLANNIVSGTTVKLLSNTNECITLSSALTLTIDLNGKTWSCTGTALTISAAATITINDTSSSVGTITATSYVINSGSSPTINIYRGIIKTTSTSSSIYAIYVHPATLTIGNETSTTSNLQIIGNAGTAIYMNSTSNVKIIRGLVISTSNNAIYASSGTLQIGNTIYSNSGNLRILTKASSVYSVNITSTDVKRYFYAGFIGAGSSSYYAYLGASSGSWTAYSGALRGISVSQTVSNTAQYYYGYTPATVYIEDNNKYYSSMTAAINAAPSSGYTFTLQNDFTECISTAAAVNFTIATNGKIWSCSSGNALKATGSGTITITDTSGTIKTISGTAVYIAGSVNLTVKGGNIYGPSNGIQFASTGTLTVGSALEYSLYNYIRIYCTSGWGIYLEKGKFVYYDGFMGSGSGYAYAYRTGVSGVTYSIMNSLANVMYGSAYYGKCKAFASGNGTNYRTVTEAITSTYTSSSATSRSTVKLLANTKEYVKLTQANATLDLSGFNLYYSGYPLYLYGSSADIQLYITDTSVTTATASNAGSVYSTSNHAIYINNSGGSVYLYLYRGTIISKAATGSYSAVYVSSNAGSTGAYVTVDTNGFSNTNKEEENALKVLTNSTNNYAVQFASKSCTKCALYFYGGFIASKKGYSYTYNVTPSVGVYTISKSYVYYSGYTYTGVIASESPEATSDSTQYSKISDAVRNASTTSGTTTTIQLQTDTTDACVSITSVKYIKFDLNGMEWKCSNLTMGALYITAAASITITDTSSSVGTIINDQGMAIYAVEATLIISKGIIRSYSTDSHYSGIFIYSGTLNISSSSVTISGNAGSAIYIDGGTANINGGTIYSNSTHAIYTENQTVLNVGTKTNTINNLQIYSLSSNGYGVDFGEGTFTFNGGFIGSIGGYSYAYTDHTTPTTNGVIVNAINGAYKGKTVYYISDSNDKYFSTISAALSGTTSGSTIKLEDDMTECVSFSVTKNVTIDLNGKTWTCTSGNALILSGSSASSYTVRITDNSGSVGTITSASDTISASFNGTLEIAKGKIITTKASTSYAAIWRTGGQLVIGTSDVTASETTLVIQATSSASAVYYSSTSTVTINKGKLVSSTGNALYISNSSATVTMNGGMLSSTSGYGLKLSSGTVTLNGGSITSFNSYGVYLYSTSANFTANAATITGASGIYVTSGTATINGATITAGTSSGTGQYAVYATSSNSTINTNGGTFKSDDYSIYAYNGAIINITKGTFQNYIYVDSSTLTFGDSTSSTQSNLVSSEGIIIKNNSTASIRGGKIYSTTDIALYAYNQNSISIIGDTKIYSTNDVAISLNSKDYLTISLGAVIYSTADNAIDVLTSCNLVVYGGIIYATGSGFDAIYVNNGTVEIGAATNATTSNLIIYSNLGNAIYSNGSSDSISIYRGYIYSVSEKTIFMNTSGASITIGSTSSTVDSLRIIATNSYYGLYANSSGITMAFAGGFIGGISYSYTGIIAGSSSVTTPISGTTIYRTTVRQDGTKYYGSTVLTTSSYVAHTVYNSNTFYYDTIQRAVEFLDSSTSTSQTIILDASPNGSVAISTTKNGKINLNGKTWSNGGSTLINLSGQDNNASYITITDTSADSSVGTISSYAYSAIYLDFNGTLIIEKGKITSSSTQTILVQGGTVTPKLVIGSSSSNTTNLQIINTAPASACAAIKIQSLGNITINGGYISSYYYGVMYSSVTGGTLNVYNGVIYSKNAEAIYSYNSSPKIQIGDSTTTSSTLKLLSTVSGGKAIEISGGGSPTLTIHGGFMYGGYDASITPTLYGSAYSASVSYNSTSYSGIKFVVASVGSTYYETLTSAINAASSATVKLLSNRQENVSISSAKTVIIDLNGYTWEYYGTAGYANAPLKIYGNAGISVNITDSSSGVGTISGLSGSGVGIYFLSGTLKITKGIIKGYTAGIYSTDSGYQKNLIIGTSGSTTNESISVYGVNYGIYSLSYLKQSMQIYGGYIKGNTSYGVYFQASGNSTATTSTLEIYGGTIIGKSSDGAVYARYYSSSYYYGPNVTIGNQSTSTPDNLKIVNLNSSGYAVKTIGYSSSYKATLTINAGFMGSNAGSSFAYYVPNTTTITVNGELYATTSPYTYKEGSTSSTASVSGKAVAVITYYDGSTTSYCNTLQACFDKLPAYNASISQVPVITLLANRNEYVAVTASKIGKVDLNGKTWSHANSVLSISGTTTSNNNSIITIDDSVGTGIMKLTSSGGLISASYIGTSGKLTILRGNYYGHYETISFYGMGTLEIGGSNTTSSNLFIQTNGDYNLVYISGASSTQKAKLVVNDGSIGNASGADAISAYYTNGTVSGGEIIGGGEVGIRSYASTFNINGTASITTRDGRIDEYYGIYATSSSTINISSDGVRVEAIYSSSSTININGGQIVQTAIGHAMFLVSGNCTIYKGIVLGNVFVAGATLTVGVIDTEDDIYSSSKDIAILDTEVSEAVAVSSGTFIFNRGFIGSVDQGFTYGYICSSSATCNSHDNLDTTYVYGGATYYGIAVAVASIGSDMYLTLEDAFEELNETSKTIKLLGHVDESIDIDTHYYSAFVAVIDLNGYTWYSKYNKALYGDDVDGVTITFKDSSSANSGVMYGMSIGPTHNASYIYLYSGTFKYVDSYGADLILGDEDSTSSNLRILNSSDSILPYSLQKFIYNGGFIEGGYNSGSYRTTDITIYGKETSTSITYKGTIYTGIKLNVAKISSGSSTYYYETLQTAFNSSYVSGSNTSTLTLLGNRQERVVLTRKINVMLNLNGFTWTDPNDSSSGYVLNFITNDSSTKGSYLYIYGGGTIKSLNNLSEVIYINASTLSVSNATIGGNGTTPAIRGNTGSTVNVYSSALISNAFSLFEITNVYMQGGILKGSSYNVANLYMNEGNIYGSTTITSKLVFNGGFIGTTSSTKTNGLYTPYTLSGATKVVNGVEINATKTYSGTTYYGLTVGIAHIEDTYYTDLQEAFDALGTSGKTLVLDANIEDVDVYIEDNAVKGTFDLNGHTWSGDIVFSISNANTVLHITDNSGSVGAIRNNCDSSAILISKGTVYLDKGFYSNTMPNDYALYVGSEGTLYIGNSSASTSNNLRIWTEGDDSYSIYGYGSESNIYINGGVIGLTNDGNSAVGDIYSAAGGTVTLNGGTIFGCVNISGSSFNAYKGVIHAQETAISVVMATINIGRVDGVYTTKDDLQIISMNNGSADFTTGLVIVNGSDAAINFNGGFIGAWRQPQESNIFSSSSSVLTNIDGHMMSTSVNHLYYGYEYYGYALAAAHIDSTYYLTLQEAFNASGTNNKTIVLDRNIVENVSVSGIKATLDLNGKTWCVYSGGVTFNIAASSVITVIDNSGSRGEIKTAFSSDPAIKVNASTLNVYKGKISGYGNNAINATNSSTINIGQHKDNNACLNGIQCSEGIEPITSLNDIYIYTIGTYSISGTNSTINVYGGNIASSYGGIATNGGSLTIGDEASSVDNLQIVSGGTSVSTTSTTVKFRGGFVGTSSSTKDSNGFYQAFNSNPSNSGLYNWQSSSYYGVTIAVAHIGSTYYNTLRKALIMAVRGTDKMVVLDNNVNEKIELCGDVSFTINLNGHTWNNNEGDILTFKSALTNATNVTIKNSSSSSGGMNSYSRSAIVVESGAKPTILIDSIYIYSNQYGIENYGSPTISTSSSVTNRSVTISAMTAIYDAGSGVLTLDNAYINAYEGIYLYNSTSHVTINASSTIEVASAAISVTGTSSATIDICGTVESTTTFAVDFTSPSTINVKPGGSVVGGIKADNGTINVLGGSISGSTGISSSSNNILNVSGGTVTGNDTYAIYASGKQFNFTSGTLQTSGSVSYTYSIDKNTSYTIPGEEYTSYNSSNVLQTVIKTNVASIGTTNYNTLQSAIDAAQAGNVIVVKEDITPSRIVNGRRIYTLDLVSKNLTINLNGKEINNFIYNDLRESTSYSFINISGGSVKVVGNGSINVVMTNAYVINNVGGSLTIGDETTQTVSETSPVIENKTSSDYAIYNSNNAMLMFYNGSLISGSSSVYTVFYIDESSKIITRVGHHIEYTHVGNVHTAKLVEGSLIDDQTSSDGGIKVNYSVDSAGNLTITINSTLTNNSGSEKVTLDIAKRDNDTVSYAKYECKLTGGSCSTTIEKKNLPYLYNVTYGNELVIKYENSVSGKIAKQESVSKDLTIVPKEDVGYDVVNTNGIQIISDKDVLVIYNHNGSVNLNEYKDSILASIFGAHYSSIVTITNDLPTNANCSVTDLTCSVITSLNLNVTYNNSSVPVASSGNTITYTKVIMYDFAPKLNPSTVTQNQSVTTCEYGSECNVETLSFVDYMGNEINNVTSVVTLNGEVVDNVDSSKLGSYVVTTYALDNLGNKSMDIVRTYNIVDTVAPVINVSEDVLYAEKGHKIRNWDISAYDNFDEDVSVEVITSKVNFNKNGSYTVIYKAIDSSGNTTIVEGTIIVRNHIEIILTSVIIALLVVIGVMGYIIYRKKKLLK